MSMLIVMSLFPFFFQCSMTGPANHIGIYCCFDFPIFALFFFFESSSHTLCFFGLTTQFFSFSFYSSAFCFCSSFTTTMSRNSTTESSGQVGEALHLLHDMQSIIEINAEVYQNTLKKLEPLLANELVCQSLFFPNHMHDSIMSIPSPSDVILCRIIYSYISKNKISEELGSFLVHSDVWWKHVADRLARSGNFFIEKGSTPDPDRCAEHVHQPTNILDIFDRIMSAVLLVLLDCFGYTKRFPDRNLGPCWRCLMGYSLSSKTWYSTLRKTLKERGEDDVASVLSERINLSEMKHKPPCWELIVKRFPYCFESYTNYKGSGGKSCNKLPFSASFSCLWVSIDNIQSQSSVPSFDSKT